MVNSTKIAVAMSGGVDSSVAALLLQRAGHDVVGVNLNLWSCFKGGAVKSCCSPEDRQDARRVCEYLKIPFISMDLRDNFKQKIIIPFVKEYSIGRTPNPCIPCNSLIKFGDMLGRVREELGIETIATGHYARVTNAGGTCRLMRGADISKDQSYFLFDISPETLSRVIFPLGELKKSDVRRLALDAGLPVAEKPESQEVCFVPDGDIAGFIDSFYPEYSPGPGSYVDTEGRRIGSHRGIHGYTVGQRRGLGIGFGERQYVVEIKQATNEIVLGGSADLYKRVLKVGRLNLSPSLLMGEEKGFGKNFSFDARVKIRYKSEAVPARITTELFPSLACPETCRRNGRGEERVKTALIEFETPVRAPTPGQAAVFYQGDVIVGGGWIL